MELDIELGVSIPLDRGTFKKGEVLDGGDVQGEDGVRGNEGDEELPASPTSALSVDKDAKVDVADVVVA